MYDGLVRARVPGRMEVYANADGRVLSIVDYAHNRLSFETLFSSVRAEYPERELAIVFGCPGKKAYDRRHDLGEAAGAWCDRVYLTEEDSGEEDTLDICNEIRPNVEKGKARCRIIPNRPPPPSFRGPGGAVGIRSLLTGLRIATSGLWPSSQ